MSSNFDDRYEWEMPEDTKPRWPRWKRWLFGFISVIVIISLFGYSISSIFLWVTEEDEAGLEEATLPVATVPFEAAEVNTETAVEETVDSAVEPEPAAFATPVVDLNRIAFINTSGQVETVDPDGNDGRTLTDEDMIFQFPAWAPQGNRIAVIGGGSDGGGIYLLQDEEDAAPVEQYFSRRENPFYLYWSPDGRQISFLANHPSEGIALRLADVGGEDDSRLVATGSPFYWNWTANGEQILAHTGAASDDSRLAIIDVAGESRRGESIADPGFFQAPGISASGRYLSYAEEQMASMSWLVVTDTESGAQYEERHAGLLAMSWRPSGDQLAFISGRPNMQQFYGPLRLLDVATEEVTLLTRDLVIAFFWSPDGRYIAYLTVPGFGEEDTQVKTSPHTRLARRSAQGFDHAFDLMLVEVETGQRRWLASFEPTFTFLSQFLPFFDQYTLSHQIWSPDSRALVLPVRDDGSKVTVYPIDGGEPQIIGEGDMPFWSPH